VAKASRVRPGKGGSGENFAALGVSWLCFEFQHQATPSTPSTSTRSRSVRRTYALDTADHASMKVVLAGSHKFDDGARPYFFVLVNEA